MRARRRQRARRFRKRQAAAPQPDGMAPAPQMAGLPLGPRLLCWPGALLLVAPRRLRLRRWECAPRCLRSRPPPLPRVAPRLHLRRRQRDSRRLPRSPLRRRSVAAVPLRPLSSSRPPSLSPPSTPRGLQRLLCSQTLSRLQRPLHPRGLSMVHLKPSCPLAARLGLPARNVFLPVLPRLVCRA